MGERVKLYVGNQPARSPMDLPILTVKETKPKRTAKARTARQNPSRRGGFAGGLVSYTGISKVK